MPKRLDLIGQKFHSLIVLKFADANTGHSKWLCACDCGNNAVVVGAKLVNGHTQSCGCLQKRMAHIANVHHGHAQVGSVTKEYSAWCNMRRRCEKPSNADFKDYGGRGIKVCKRWLVFENFIADMGLAPTREHSIDRKRTNGNYTPENCKWSTKKEQARNKRNSVFLEAFGKRMTLAEWAETLGVDRRIIHHRLSRGKSIESALTF